VEFYFAWKDPTSLQLFTRNEIPHKFINFHAKRGPSHFTTVYKVKWNL